MLCPSLGGSKIHYGGFYPKNGLVFSLRPGHLSLNIGIHFFIFHLNIGLLEEHQYLR